MKINNFGKAIILTAGVATTMTLSTIQSEACGIGSIDFKVNNSYLNVRNLPGTHGTVVKKLKLGDVVTPQEIKGGWARIGDSQWVAYNYLTMMKDNCTIPENGESYEEIKPTEYIVTNTNSLNVRDEPSTKAEKITTFAKGQKVTATKKHGEWRYVTGGSHKGWVHSAYLATPKVENNTQIQEIEVTTYKVVGTNALKLRKEPNTNSEIYDTFASGKLLYATKIFGNWIFVTDGHNEGWSYNAYLEKVENQNDSVNNTQKPTPIKGEVISMRELEVIKTDSLNVRSGPGTNYSKVGTLKRGETAMTNERLGDWFKIDEYKWVHKNYVKETIWSLNSNSTWEDILDVPPMEEEKSNIKKVSSPDGELNVRFTAVLSGAVKDVLKNGDEVEVISESNGRSYIKYTKNGQEKKGYVASRFIK